MVTAGGSSALSPDEVVFTMRPPPPRATACFANACETRNVPLRWTAITESHIGSSSFMNVLSRRMPALLTSTSTFPNVSIPSAMIACAPSAEATES